MGEGVGERLEDYGEEGVERVEGVVKRRAQGNVVMELVSSGERKE